ncbi:MAG: hypothetical protein HOO95_00660 [Gallionella sp.]|nr:hypothetical protein [Gallionella sp.]
MSLNDDETNDNKPAIFTDAQPLAPKKYIPAKSSHQDIKKRIQEKKTLALDFMGSGEVWTTMKMVSHILELGVRQTQATLSHMVRDNLLKTESLAGGLRIYGISPLGLANINATGTCPALSLGKTIPRTTDHHLVIQKIRLELEKHYQAENWVTGKTLYKNKLFKSVPDALFTHRGRIFAVEGELNVKSRQRMKEVLKNYYTNFFDLNDPLCPIHYVIYFTPHVGAVRDLINEFVPIEFRRRFRVIHIDTEIQSYRKEERHYLDTDLHCLLFPTM